MRRSICQGSAQGVWPRVDTFSSRAEPAYWEPSQTNYLRGSGALPEYCTRNWTGPWSQHSQTSPPNCEANGPDWFDRVNSLFTNWAAGAS